MAARYRIPTWLSGTGTGYRAAGTGYRAARYTTGFRAAGYRIQGFQVQDTGLPGTIRGCQVQDTGCLVQDTGLPGTLQDSELPGTGYRAARYPIGFGAARYRIQDCQIQYTWAELPGLALKNPPKKNHPKKPT
jgi:hypothetical protein